MTVAEGRGTVAADAPRRLVVVGGGLAGLATAAALAEARLAGAPLEVELWEARRLLGGRAGSYFDAPSGQWVDLCQHVSLGCCTNLADFCRRTGIAALFRRDRTIWFSGPNRRTYRLRASRWLPAPLHLAPALARLGYLSLGDRWRIGRAMWRLLGTDERQAEQEDFGGWLVRHRQSQAAIEQFWGVVLVSALAEHTERVSVAAARQVFVEGFLLHRRGADVEVPQAALTEIYGEPLIAWLAARGVRVRTGLAAKRVAVRGDGTFCLVTSAGEERSEGVVLAVPWRQLPELLDEALAARLPWVAGLAGLAPSPITGVHLWYDRPILSLPHVVLVGRLGQWIFARQSPPLPVGEADAQGAHYYQVVISARHELADNRPALVESIARELAEALPAAQAARLLRWRVVSEPAAVFSPAPGAAALRPAQATSVPGLFVAGDWTATGWPATMEGAVRSGRLAAQAVLAAHGCPQRCLAPDLPVGILARAGRWLARRV